MADNFELLEIFHGLTCSSTQVIDVLDTIISGSDDKSYMLTDLRAPLTAVQALIRALLDAMLTTLENNLEMEEGIQKLMTALKG